MPPGPRQDEGYCWVILASSCLLNALSSGCYASFSVFFPEYVDYFKASKAEVTVVGAMAIGMSGLTGVAVGPMAARLGNRCLILFGAVVVTVGLCTSSVVGNLHLLYFTQGFLPGLGFCCYSTGGFLSIMQYFNRRRSLAFGISMAGNSIGDFIMPQVVRFLIDKYTWRGAILILGGIQMQGFILGLLIRPLKVRKEEVKHIQGHAANGDLTECPEFTSNSSHRPEPKGKLASFMNSTILVDKKAVLFLVSGAIIFQGNAIPYIFLPARALACGADFTRAALLVSILGGCSGVCRPLFGWFGDRIRKHRTLIIATSGFLTGAATAMSYRVKHYATTAVLFGFVGCLGAGFIGVHGAILGDVVPAHKMAHATGVLMTCFYMACFVTAPFGGYLIDVTGDYATPFLVFGVTMMLGSLLSFTLYCLQQRDRRRRDSQGQIGAEGPHGQMDTGETHG